MVEDDELLVCSVCQSPFDIEGEGGISGVFGICPVAFCVWCYTSSANGAWFDNKRRINN